MNLPEIKPGIFAVGSRDWNRRLFDSLIPLPRGTSYNAYLVKGSAMNALIDTVQWGFEHELLPKIDALVGLKNLNYLVMNHAEPDHAGSIPAVMAATPAILLASEKGAKVAETYFQVPRDRIRAVKEGDAFPLGGKTLHFVDAPWCHWPETMFTWVPEDKVLFPCDFFGSHDAYSFLDTESEQLIPSAKRYFAEIMMPFRPLGRKALEKVKALGPSLIAPSHGPVWTRPATILDAYSKWTAGETKLKAVIAYVSMWNSTEEMAKAMAEGLLAEGIEVALYNLVNADIGELAMDLADARAVVLGSPTVLGGLHPVAAYAVTLVKALKPPLKYGAFLSSFGWAGGAGKTAVGMLDGTGIELAGAIEIFGQPGPEVMNQVGDLAKTLAGKMKG